MENHNENHSENQSYYRKQNPFDQQKIMENMADFMKNFTNPEIFASAAKSMPMMDFSSFSNILKKNAEVISATNQMATDNMQSMIKKNAESLQDNTTQLMSTIKSMSSSSDMEHAASHGKEFLRNSFENSVNTTKELIDMASKASLQMFELIGKNMSENVSKACSQTKA